jgi:hypothetical protein
MQRLEVSGAVRDIYMTLVVLGFKIGVEMAAGIKQRCSPSRHQSFGSRTRWEHTTVKSSLDSKQMQTFLYLPQHEKRLW